VKPKARSTRRKTGKRTELRRASQQAARRLARAAAEREWRVFLAAKFDRTWKALLRFRGKVGAARFRELMTGLPSTIYPHRQEPQRQGNGPPRRLTWDCV